MLIAVGLVLVVLLTLATGYFVAQEFAYVSVDRNRLRQLADEGDAAAARALDITGRLSFTLSGAQFGITVTALLVGYAGEPLIGVALADLLGFTDLPYAARLAVAVALVLVFSTVLQMVVGELAPKNLAIARPIPLARSLSRSTQVYLAVAGPLIHLFDGASNRLLRAVGIEPVEELSPGATTADLEHVIDESRKRGALDEDLSLLLERGLAYRALSAEQAMTPRVDVDTVPATSTLAAVVDLLRTSPHSRFPVVAQDVDDVVGIVGLAELLEVPRESWGSVSVQDACSAAVVVPGSLPLPAALEQLRASRRQLAVVVDEFGGFDGVLSLEDIAEEVVGDIFDEGDEREPEPPEGPADTHTLSARLRLDEVESSTGVRLPLGADYATVSGLVLGRLGRVARPGDTVTVDEVVEPGDVDDPSVPDRIEIRVDEVERHVPAVVTLLRLRSDPTQERTP
ncbi:MAG TPA: hemolysin family protein [Lapillicoccus sp.]|uniref:hemolysin family protein n=1 Tax=Lapillicoccus sp. TaxID=1909287 RepID=UPI002F955375